MKSVSNKFLRLFVTVGASVCYLGTQCVFAYQPEKNFWLQRRKSAQDITSSPSVCVRPGDASFQFPTGPVLASSAFNTAAGSNQAVPSGFLHEHKALIAALPSSNGSIRRITLPQPATPPGPVIVHIQDVHMNLDAQKNIGAVVSSLIKAGLVNLVALEGSTEEIDLQVFADSPHRKAAEMTADYLLRENMISGPIHAAITHRGPLPRILGVDHPAHYKANVQAYLDSVPVREKSQQTLNAIRLETERLKKRVYSTELAVFDAAVTNYREGKLSLGEYMEVLSATSGLPINHKERANVADFLNAYRTERSLDFKRVELERGQLIEKLTQSLTKGESDEMVAQGVAFRSGQLRYGEFYSYLAALCSKKRIRLADYPAMDAYVRYLLKADAISAEGLLEEMGDMEKDAYTLLAKTLEEKDLVKRARREFLTGKLLDFSLIPAEWNEYKSGPRTEALWSFENFYEQAQARDTAMADHVLQALTGPSTPGQVVLLVTGGFHGRGLTERLTARGATVVSFVPKIEKIDTAQGAAYLSVFSQEKTPLEKLAQREKLFLAANPLSSEIKKTVLPALFAMVVVGYTGSTLGLDLNAIYSAMGGVGVLALTKLLKDYVEAQLRVGKNTGSIKVSKNFKDQLSVEQTPGSSSIAKQIRDQINRSQPVGAARATGWIGVGVTYIVGWSWVSLKKFLGIENSNMTVRTLAVNFVKENNGQRAAIAEDVISTLVAVSVGLWTLAILGPSMTFDWKLFYLLYIAIVWPLLLLRSHVDPREKLSRTFGISPSVAKAVKLSGFVFVVVIVVSLVFVALRLQFPLIAEIMIPVFGGASFFVLRAFHKGLNEGKPLQEGDIKKAINTVLVLSSILGFLGFSPDLAEAAVRSSQVTSHASVLGFLISVFVFLAFQIVSLVRLNNTSSPKIPTVPVATLPRPASPANPTAPPSIENRAQEEIRVAFDRFARSVGIDPSTARFGKLRPVKGVQTHFEQVIFAGGRSYLGQAVAAPLSGKEGSVVRARIVMAKSKRADAVKNEIEQAPLVVNVPSNRTEELEKGMSFDEPHETLSSMESLLREEFQSYATRKGLDLREAKMAKPRLTPESNWSAAVYVGAKRFIVEALRYHEFSEGALRAQYHVTVYDADEPSNSKGTDQRAAKQEEERGQWARNFGLPPLKLGPNNILFLLAGKHPLAGYVIDAAFLLGAAASGAWMGLLLPAFALLHVALERRNGEIRGFKEGSQSFFVHLVFVLPYALVDFSGGAFQIVPWLWATLAVAIHGIYDKYAIGFSDGANLAKLTRGSVSERIGVLMGPPSAVTGSFDGSILSTGPDFLRRVTSAHQGFLYRLGLKNGAARYAGQNNLVPVIEYPVSNENDLAELLTLAEKTATLNLSSPGQKRFITVTPQEGMTVGQINAALSERKIPNNFVYVKSLSGSILFENFEKEFGAALEKFGLEPNNAFILLAGRPDIVDLEQTTTASADSSELRRTLLNALFGPMPVVTTAVILEMLNAMALAAKNA